MKKHKVVIQFVLILTVSALAGAACSFLFRSNQTALSELLQSMEAFFHQNVLWLYLFSSIIVLIPTIVFYLKGNRITQKLLAAQSEETELADRPLSLAALFSTLGINLQFFFFGSAVYYGFQEKIGRYILIATLFLLLFSSLLTFFSIRCIKCTKQLNPTKHADPLDLKFDKKWVQQSDEQERFVMYQAAFKSFMLLKYTLIFSWVILLLFSLIAPIGILPFFLISLLWALHSCSYTVYSNSAYRNRQK